jgi:hypothetical protein
MFSIITSSSVPGDLLRPLAALLVTSVVAGAQSRVRPVGPPIGQAERLVDDIELTEQQRLGAAPTAWPGGVVYFKFAPDVTPGNRDKMHAAMDLWNYSGAKVTFVPDTPGVSPYVFTINNSTNDTCSSSVGFNGSHSMQVAQWCFDWQIGLAHELCHQLGFRHEQSRPDRDSFVTINDGTNGNPDLVLPGAHHNFLKHASWISGGLLTGYDYDSMMHYPKCAFTICGQCIAGCETIVAPQPIGQGTHLSVSDIADMVNVYGSRGPSTLKYVTSVLQGNSGDGTLEDPRRSAFWAVVESNGPDAQVYLYTGVYNTTFNATSPFLIDKPVTLTAMRGPVTLE